MLLNRIQNYDQPAFTSYVSQNILNFQKDATENISKFDSLKTCEPPWRNGLAHWTSNSKVVGSSPTGGVQGHFFLSIFLFIDVKFTYVS